MKTINLAYPEKSDIKFKISKFPDGQQNVVLSRDSFAGIFGLELTKDAVQIKSRLNNWLDLELITCTVASLREIDPDIKIHLYVPYIMGARSDRKFEEGGNNYLKDVICPMINALNFKTVTCVDPHSDCLEMGIKGFRKVSNLGVLQFAQVNIYERMSKEELHSKYILVSPDAGASKKIYKLAEQIGYKGDIITCSKDRDTEGKLTKVNVPLTLHCENQDFIIIDDICDGGATFINIAKELKKSGAMNKDNKIYLIVTHGIFSKGFEELSKYFDGIYCTNSYRDICTDHGYTPKIEKHSSIVNQLNIF